MKKQLLIIIILACSIICGAQTPWNGTIAESYDGGDGTPANPYQIATAEQLALLAQQTNEGTGGDAFYILTSDICLNANLNVNPLNWIPIGRVVNGTPSFFTGHFDGNNKTVSGLYYNNPDDDEVVGLFGCTYDAEIYDINLSNCSLSGSEYVGALVGRAGFTNISGCDIDHVTVNCEVRSAGGLVGFFGLPYGVYEDATETYLIIDCHAHQGVMVFGRLAGGLVGEISEYLLGGPSVPSVVSDCSSEALVEGTSSVGGIAGSFRNGKIDHCICWNEVHSSEWAGGMVGCGIALNVYNCVNCTYAVASMFCGGMVGYLYGGNLAHCENYGQIEGNGVVSKIGGMVGKYLPDPLLVGTDCEYTIRDCHNHGNVAYSSNYAGGIIGHIEGSATERLVVVDCSNNGRLHHHSSYAGGIIGYNHSFVMSLLNVYNTGDVGAEFGVGGILGIANHNTIVVMNAYNTGELTHEINNYVCPMGSIVGKASEVTQFSSCYWLSSNDYGSNGQGPQLESSCAFNPTASPSVWQLETPMHNTTDLLAALNDGAAQIENEFPSLDEVSRWREDDEFNNGGFPIFGHQYTTIEEQETKHFSSAYPNPGKNVLNIRTALQNARVEVYNSLGHLVLNLELLENVTTINTNSWPSGTYFWKVISNNKEAESGKWIKQ